MVQMLSFLVCLTLMKSCTPFENQHPPGSIKIETEYTMTRIEETEKVGQPTSQPSTLYMEPSRPESYKTRQPTSQPSTLYMEPSRPESYVTVVPTRKPVVAAKSNVDDKDKSKISNNNDIGGAQDINKEIEEEDDTALSSAKYFFLTFVCFIAIFVGIHSYQRNCSSGNSSVDIKPPRYSVLNTTEPTEEDEGAYFSNRNLELAHRPPAL